MLEREFKAAKLALTTISCGKRSPAEGAMSQMHVECYAGHKADERPLRFVLRGRQFEVHELDGQWYSPDATYFRVRADDGNFYVLRHDEAQDFWTLDGFRAAR
jgi:hypothetical protein